MSDIVKQLREAKTTLGHSLAFGLVAEAADTIESLSADLQREKDGHALTDADNAKWRESRNALLGENKRLRDALKMAREVLADERYISRYSQVVEAIAAIDAAMKGE